ncbi:hypothetical protein CHPC1034_0025 [Streptococcus phage CHPC1034]|nr:hypothetical protein CHPC1034_0025 [Streptococcus phage CHPC1034]
MRSATKYLIPQKININKIQNYLLMKLNINEAHRGLGAD